MLDTSTKPTAVACDDCGQNLTYTVTTSDDGDVRYCVLACGWCGAVADEKLQRRHVSTAIVCFGGGKSQTLSMETWS